MAAGEGDRRSYLILREDGLAIHTKPITVDDAWWLEDAYSARFLSREARARYLAEWGNVMDVGKYVDFLEQLDRILYHDAARTYSDPERLTGLLARPLDDPQLPPEARQTVKELLDKIEDFLRRPVEPRPVDAPVRYLELSHPHVRLGPDNVLEEVRPRPELLVYGSRGVLWGSDLYGISVFKDSLWLWFQSAYTWAVAVRRDVDDREVINAVLGDEAVQGFLRWFLGQYGDDFRELLRKSEAVLIDKGYEDVIRKAKVVLATLDLLNAGRREEEGVPA